MIDAFSASLLRSLLAGSDINGQAEKLAERERGWANAIMAAPTQAERSMAFSAVISSYPDAGEILASVLNSPFLENLPPDSTNGKQIIVSTWLDLERELGPIVWDWDRWVARAILTIAASESGKGKSALMLRIAACYLRGDPWPDGQPFTGEQGAVIWCEAEAGQAINLQRAKEWQLPIEKIYTPGLDPFIDFVLNNPGHLDALKRRAVLPEVQAIVIDSLSGADGKAEKSTEDAQSIKPLAELARDIQKPILITHHLRKRSPFEGDSVTLDRLRGSSALVQTARMVWAIDTPDPQAKEWRRLQAIKSNLAAFPDPLGFTIDTDGVRFGSAPAQPRSEGQIERAVDLLRSLLQDEPQSAEYIKAEFDGAGISEATMRRAKDKLKVVSRKNKAGWTWALPEVHNYEYTDS